MLTGVEIGLTLGPLCIFSYFVVQSRTANETEMDVVFVNRLAGEI